MDGYVKEDANTASGVLKEASTGSFTTDSPKGNGKGANKILLHSTEGSNGGGTSGLNLYGKVTRKNGPSGKTPAHFTIDIKNKKVFQHLNSLRVSSDGGTFPTEPEPYQLRIADNKVYIRNAENIAWIWLFDVKYRMGIAGSDLLYYDLCPQ